MRFLSIIALLFLLVGSCDEQKPDHADLDQGTEIKSDLGSTSSSISLDGTYFKANGNEPFWSLEISDQTIIFKTLTDSHSVS